MQLVAMLLLAFQADAKVEDPFAGLAFRGIGPAIASGRIADLAVDPENPYRYFVAAASGGVWFTGNGGTTFQPLFDEHGSYSIGCVTLDPSNSNTVWVGTGENNSQRSVGYGDGVYKSLDGGKTWKHMGLKDSQHIGKIVVHPRDPNIVYVASQGPLWNDGGDRGLFKTVDGGDTWTKILDVSEQTGINEVHLDPRDPDTIYATSYQRRRHVWTLIDGGPESTIYKSTDGGESFRKIDQGLPKVDMGRIGIAIAPSQPDTIYAVVEAAQGKGGFYRSLNRGESWERMGDYVTGSPQYYQEIYVHPKDANTIFAMDTWLQVSDDAGKTFHNLGEQDKHVDNHALWIDPSYPNHMLVGCDGGIYETFDRAATWDFKANLPVTQFYRLALDNASPYYNVYGGTQDNFTLGGPSRTENQHGIVNSDWFIVVGGDGFEPQVDPENPDIVYGQSQYGGLVRHDRASGEITDIQPQPEPDGPALVWNWDAPLLISHHQPSRLYFAGNMLFRSDDRGQSWRALGGDLTRQLDRNRLPVMGRIWPIDAVAKNMSTSIFGNIVSLSESPIDENLLAVGTDDGLVQISEDGGDSWRRLERFPKVPDMTYVQALWLSQHARSRLFAAFNNHKRGDFKPYLMVSDDLGKSWTHIDKGLPQRGSVYAIAEDHVDGDLLFAGTEFSLFYSRDRGRSWTKHNAGLPTVAVRDIAIQRRENDLVLGTFGRGFFVLDDYTPMRRMDDDVAASDGHLFPVKDARRYVPRLPLGLRDKSFQGASYFAAPNPPHGAIFTVYFKEDHKSLTEQRRESEKKAFEAKEDPGYPAWDELREEALQRAPDAFVEVRDDDGGLVRRISCSAKKGLQRVNWDLRWIDPQPVRIEPFVLDNPFMSPPQGPLVAPGTYHAQLFLRQNDQLTPIGEARAFDVTDDNVDDAAAQAILAFQHETAELYRRVSTASAELRDLDERLDYLLQAALETPSVPYKLVAQLQQHKQAASQLRTRMSGDAIVARHQEATLPGIENRIAQVMYGHWDTTGAVTQTHRDQVKIARDQYDAWLTPFKQLEDTLALTESLLIDLGIAYTPGQTVR